MAGRNIKGITVEIGGDTTGLQNALSEVNGKIKNTQAQLKDVNSLLKLDPSNTVLVAQKQELLSDAIAESTEKLNKLETMQKDVNAAMEAGDIGQEQYMAFQREVEETRAVLGRYEAELEGLSTEQDRLAKNTERLEKLFDITETSVDDYADVLGAKLVTAIKNGSATADQLKLAIEKIGKSATNGKADIKQLTEALDTVDDGQAIQNLIKELKDTGTQADSTSEQLEEMGNKLTGGMLLEAVDQLTAVGDKIIELGDKATEAFTETNNATVKASSYFGETGDAAEQTASIIKNVYAEGVGDSMDAVSDAVVSVKKNLKDLDESELTNLTKQAITLEDLYGIDMNETLRGVNSLMVNFGMTAQEAMDYIVKGTQNGLDKTNELGDNLAEYSGKFSQAGYSAQEYFQLLQNGLDGGAYNLDKVNDAINEVTTRLVDGTIEDSIGGFSTKTQELFKSWQEGEATQKDVINSIVADIAGCQNQQEQLNLAATAFGTMAEDGSAKFIKSLTTMGDNYDDVNGSAQSMFDSSTTEAQKYEASIRQLKQSLEPLGEMLMDLANQILPPVTAAVQTVADFFGKLPGPVQDFALILGGLIAVLSALTPVIVAVAVAVTALEAPLLPIIAIIALVVAAVAGIIAIVKNWGSITEWFGNLWQAVKEKCVVIWDSICSFFTETIPAAWDKLVEKFQNVQEWWSGIWQQVGDFFFEIWDEICSFFTETIPNAWQNVVSWFQSIPEWWAGIWQQVEEFFSQIWKNMMQNPILSGIATMIQTLWQNCVTTLQGIWSGLSQIASGAWELLKNTILGPVLLLIDLVTGNFERLKSDAANIWRNIQSAASSIWSGIQTVVSSLAQGLVTHVTTLISNGGEIIRNIWEMARTAASTAWSNIKQSVVNSVINLKESAVQTVMNLKDSISQLWEMVRTAASTAWSNIKQSVVNSAINLKESVVQTVMNLKNSISQAWSNLKSNALQAWQNIKDTIVNTANNLKTSAVQAFQNLVSGIRNKLSNLGSIVKNGFQDAIEFITSLPGKALEWGADFIDGLVDGIRGAIGNITDAVSDVAESIRSFLHFSVPDEGPLTEYESWMPDFMEGLARGIEKSKGMVVDAISGLSADMDLRTKLPNLSNVSGLMVGNTSLTDMIHTGSSHENDTVINTVNNWGDKVMDIMSQYFPQFANQKLVMDTGAVVGALAPEIDTQLGRIADHKGRDN